MNQALRKRGTGFTLIEMIVTLAIMGTLAMVAVPMVQITVQREKERALRNALFEIRDAIDAYKRASEQGRIPQRLGESGYPKKLEALVEGVADQRSLSKQKMYFLRRLPRDPFAPADGSSAASWGRRAYASPPDDPAEGDDVFDVYSSSRLTGLNGVPLRQW